LIWVSSCYLIIKVLKSPHPPARLLHSVIQSLPFHFATCVRYVPLSLLSFIRSSGEPPDSRSISISVTPFHSGYTNFISHAALAHTTHPLLRLMLPLLMIYPCSFHFVPTIPMLFCSAHLPAHNALLHILRLRLIYLSGTCFIAFRCVHPFAGKAAYCLSHRPSWLRH